MTEFGRADILINNAGIGTTAQRLLGRGNGETPTGEWGVVDPPLRLSEATHR